MKISKVLAIAALLLPQAAFAQDDQVEIPTVQPNVPPPIPTNFLFFAPVMGGLLIPFLGGNDGQPSNSTNRT